MGGETCETCRFWQKAVSDECLVDGGNSGECRRRAPVIVLATCPTMLLRFTTNGGGEREDEGEEDMRRVFPLTYWKDWCGEHVVTAATRP